MNTLQLKASNPEISTWVSASAGTGKTKILTDRVIRLLLNNVHVSKILCLTFTNAAAGEMHDRIIKHLAGWSFANDDELKTELEQLLGSEVTPNRLLLAKNLYEKLLTSEDKINIHTIHSFCQKLLKKFPLEADVSPNFQVIDEGKSFEIIHKIKRQVQRAEELEPISTYLSRNFHDITIDEIFNEIISNRVKFQGRDDENIYQNSKIIIDKLENIQEQKYQPILELPLLSNLIDYNLDVASLKSFFLTQEGEKKKRIVPKKIADPGSSLYSDLEQIQHQIYLLDQEEKSEHLHRFSTLISKLGISIISKYEKYKKARGLLDYDDLIIKTNKLLRKSSARDWVLYKLDGGIEHLLVDEAQDTSPLQWQIIEALIEEFHSGEEKEIDKTIFVVGDDKQSIFSFQGADITSFSRVNETLKTKLLAAQKNFETINLEISYRSAKEILDVTDQVFRMIKSTIPELFPINIPPISAFRSGHLGSVELWPLCKDAKKAEEFWPINNQNIEDLPAKKVLAIKIAEYIKSQIDNGIVLPSTGKAARPGDFMILFRTRDEFTIEVVKQIKHLGLDVAGIDRILLSANLAVLDLISAAKFTLNPEDDLNLACLLKSPLIGLREEDLQKLCQSRGKKSLWQHMQDSTHKVCIKLELFINIAKTLNAKNFFHYLADVMGFREKLVTSIGLECNDAIDELLNYSYNYATTTDCSLQSFIFWFENYQIDIKRRVENSDKIKIMTIHASKGLQAPYVIICDTTSLPVTTCRFVWDKNGTALSAKNSNYVPEFFKNLKEIEQKKSKQEYLRLLYVAMTRAEDNLVICGHQGQTKIPEHCWYNLVSLAMQGLPMTIDGEKFIYQREKFSTEYINTDNHPAEKEKIVYIKQSPHHYDHTKFEPEIGDGTNISTRSPLFQNNSLKYGLVFHKILEDGIKLGSLQNLKNHPLITTISEELQNKIKLSIDRISENKEFNDLLNNAIKTEVSVGTYEGGQVKIGRIDLLIIEENKVTVIDYKSDNSPPTLPHLVPQNYINQLNAYRNIIQKLYKNHTIFCKILWLENGRITEVVKDQIK